MLLFGGNISDPSTKIANKTSSKSTKSNHPQQSSNNSRNEQEQLIATLTAQEQTLLAQLAETRTQLQHKLLKEKNNSCQHNADKKQLKRSLSHPEFTVRTDYNILPVLTNTGETPFEVALQSKKHVLPIFRLPSVSEKANFVGKIATSQQKTKQGQLQLDQQQLQQQQEMEEARAFLGLTAEEVMELESSSAHPSISASDSIPQHNRMMIEPQTDVKKKSNKRNYMKKNRKPLRLRKAQKNHNTLLDGKKKVSTVELERELKNSIKNVQQLTQMVQKDITEVNKICPVLNVRADLFMKKWGIEKIEAVFLRIQYSILISAIQRWKAAIEYEKKMEQRQAYLHFKGSKKMNNFMTNWSKRNLVKAWAHWINLVYEEKNLENTELRTESVIKIQTAWRGFLSREFTKLVQKEQWELKQNKAASKIQAIYRGRYGRKCAKQILLQMKRNLAACQIQRLIRGRITRKHFMIIKEKARKDKAASKLQAIYRGRMGRHQTRMMKEDAKLNNAALSIQKRYRGRLGKASYIRKRIQNQKDKAATKIQTRFRGLKGRKRMMEKKMEKALYQKKLNESALKVQSIYRGHRGRLGAHLKMVAYRERQKELSVAAIKIQTIYRGRHAKSTVFMMKRKKMENMVAYAQEWGELWDEDSACYFYYNYNTGEALWEPPGVGYRQFDGQLVLMNGLVVDENEINLGYDCEKQSSNIKSEKEPEVISEEIKQEKVVVDMDVEEVLCVECEELDALKFCKECEDSYCDYCFDMLHGNGKRSSHEWKPIGAIRCMECEKEKATRWCVECDDPYCLGCFQIIHSKGKKQNHTTTDMSLRKARNEQAVSQQENTSTYHEYLNSEEYAYVSELHPAENDEYFDQSQQNSSYYGSGYTPNDNSYQESPYDESSYHDSPYGENSYQDSPYAESSYNNSQYQDYGVDESNYTDGSEWQEHYDDESGCTYYYNPSTGETQWAE